MFHPRLIVRNGTCFTEPHRIHFALRYSIFQENSPNQVAICLSEVRIMFIHDILV